MSIVDDLIAFIQKPGTKSQRDELAIRLFHDQCEAIPEYAHYTKGHDVHCITDILPVPETLYKGKGPHRSERTVKIFSSSGTSGGVRTVIELSEPGLSLMNAAIIAGAKRHLFSDGVKTRFLLLIPSPAEAPDVIMVYGMDLIARHFCYELPQFFISQGKLNFKGLISALDEAVLDKVPVTLAGGSFAFVQVLEYCQARKWKINLLPGSRCLDSGGFKGRSHEIHPITLRRSIEQIFGIPKENQINLLGMTELSSQLYDSGKVIYGQDYLEACPIKVNDPWTDTIVIDPCSGEKSKGIGMLRHIDMAIYDRPCAILTADIGISVDEGFCFVRRACGYKNRGCSLTQELFLDEKGNFNKD